ncbi:hypothetical protein CSB93_2055 [Pseudomonas paraeruginosa]|uniref:Uncharacterized protein n=1 Tax=Pseudomonas paraeruginosa TaxID=2994495 RepID=A0A2R3IMK6_9PSED|nr:hypothetical protein CSB93_2055 [Pseudomonas paraeruginosa]
MQGGAETPSLHRLRPLVFLLVRSPAKHSETGSDAWLVSTGLRFGEAP